MKSSRITNNKKRQSGDNLQRRAEELSLLYQLGISLASGKDLYQTLLTLQSEILKYIQADTLFIAIYDEHAGVVKYPVFFEDGRLSPQPSRNLMEQPGLTGPVIFERKTLYLPDFRSKESLEQYAPVGDNDPSLHSFLGVPLMVNDKAIGALSTQARKIDAYTPEHIHFMETIATQAALAIDKARLLDQLQDELEERKRIEQALAFSEEKFSKAFHITPVMMTIDNAEGVFIEVNKAFIENSGFTREEILGRRASDLNMWDSPEDRQRIQKLLREQGGYKDIELAYRRKSGKMTVVLMSSEKFTMNNELYTLTSALDITERKQAEAEREKLIEELEAKNGELERFTYTVSHDLKAPLVTVNGFLGYLEQDAAAGNTERLKQDILRIQDAVNKMRLLLTELLELSRIGRMMNPPEAVSFAALINEALDLVHGRIQERGVSVRIRDAAGFPGVYGDKPRLIEALQNMIDNAAKYMGEQPNPQVEIGTQGEEDGRPVYYVRDNGMGIAPEYHDRIFGLFNKLDANSEGAGVGLALVKRIIEIHGGRIWVESQPGEGSTFYFTLPKPP
ncbi:MAG: PAS domain S-box protein [Chloroflexi bacterium]|nr:PAS domain S-box protein [Chloroflexota bacterium]